jgi:hypothetical protein
LRRPSGCEIGVLTLLLGRHDGVELVGEALQILLCGHFVDQGRHRVRLTAGSADHFVHRGNNALGVVIDQPFKN